jgi:carbohydrate kinase (thermoresistant glucokinase family)
VSAAIATDLTAIIVIGVSGAGKTTIASLLAKRLGFAFEDGDSFHPAANVEKMRAGIPLTDEDRVPWLTAIAERISKLQEEGGHAVIACSGLRRAYRDLLVGKRRSATRFVYLKGDKELIAKRLAGRHGHFMPPALLDSQFAALEEPTAAENAIVVSVAEPPHRIVEFIFRALQSGREAPTASVAMSDDGGEKGSQT